MADQTPTPSARWVQTFLARARCRALATGRPLPEQESGTAAFVDISGFTPLTESLGQHLGPRRGAEALTAVINQVFEVLIAQVHRFGGDVLGFAGDAMLCWFADPCTRALTAAHAMQQEMVQFQAIPTPDGKTHALTMKVGVAHGPVRRFTSGRPEFGRFDMLTGETLTRMAGAEHQAAKGEIVCAPEIGPLVGDAATWGPAREGFLPLLSLLRPVAADTVEELPDLPLETLRPYFPPALFDWLVSTGESFLGELRPVVSAFVRFEGLDYTGDPQAGEKLDRYVGAVQDCAVRYGGSLIRLEFGDKGSVAHVVFGAPVAHEDDEARAVGWVLELQNRVRELPFISAQYVGMTRGPVYAGALGATSRRGYTLMGDEVNASARLMQACQPGQVLVSQRIMQATQKRFSFHQFPGFQVKGKFEPVPVATPVAPLPALQQQAPDGPLIGRDAEMARLSKLLEGLLQGQGALLRLSGAEGVGKSRLVAELLQQAMQRGVRVLLGTGQSVGQHTPYLPWREPLRALLGLQGAWPVQQQAMQIQTMLQWIHPEWLPRAPLLGDLLGLAIPDTPTTAALDARLRQESLFALLGDFLAQLAAQQPLLLLIEDCHWIDEATAALILALARRLRRERVLLIVTHRPPLEPDHPLLPDLDALPHYAAMQLHELTPEAADTLVTTRLGGALPPDLLEAVQERAQGNPLFVEELAATLRDSGRLQQVAGRWTLVGVERQALVLPDSIRSVALARVDALEEEVKFTLKVASVVGRTFAPRLVRAVHPARPEAAALAAQLLTLERRDILLEEVPGEVERFKHSTTHEVAYEILLYAQRQSLHRDVARWYEVHEADGLSAHYPLLAHHYRGAEEPEQERRYARLAGEQAAAGYANAEALRYIDRALELAPAHDLPERYALLLTRERVHDLQGAREPQLQDLEALQGIADALGEEARRIEVALRWGHYAEATGDYGEAIAAAQSVTAMAQSGGDARSEAAGRLQWGRALWQQGDLPAARGQLEQTLDLARAAGLHSLEAAALLNLGIVALYQGDYENARSLLEEARRRYGELGDPVGENKALNSLGNVFSLLGDAAAAQSCYERALNVCRQIGWRRGEGVMLGNLGIAYETQGDYAAATRAHEQALQTSREIGDPWSEGRTLCNLGLVWMSQGAYGRAQEQIEGALEIYRGLGDLRDEALVLSSQSLLAHLQGGEQAAQVYGQAALQLARQLEDRATEAEALTHLGHAQAGLGDTAAAAASYRQAVAIRREIGENTLAVESLAGLARAVLAQGDTPGAAALADEILAHIASQGLDGTYEPLRIHLTCYRALRAAGDPRASAVLARAHRLLQGRAGRIGDEAMRTSFLEEVAAHREVAAALGQDPEAQAILAAEEAPPPVEAAPAAGAAVPEPAAPPAEAAATPPTLPPAPPAEREPETEGIKGKKKEKKGAKGKKDKKEKKGAEGKKGRKGKKHKAGGKKDRKGDNEKKHKGKKKGK